MVVLPVAQAQFMDAFVKSSNYFSYVLLFCQEANPPLSLSLSIHASNLKKGNVQDLGFENKGKRKNQPARLFFKLKMLRGDIVVVCSFVYQDKLNHKPVCSSLHALTPI